MRDDELRGGAAAPPHRQPHVGDRAVHGVVLRAVRVRVHPARRSARAAPPPSPRTSMPPPDSAKVQPIRELVDLRRAAARGGRPRRSSAPFATHGVVTGPSFTRPIAASSQSPSSVSPCSQIQRSACWAPQLWPAMPRQPSTSICAVRRPSAARRSAPPGAGESSFVRGSGARYIQRRGQVEERLLGGLEARAPTRRRHRSSREPRPRRCRASPTLSQSPPPAPGPGTVELRRPRPLRREQREPQRAGRRSRPAACAPCT